MSKKAYIFLADGFEDIEGLTVVDLLRRAGIDIKTISIQRNHPDPRHSHRTYTTAPTDRHLFTSSNETVTVPDRPTDVRRSFPFTVSGTGKGTYRGNPGNP